MAVTWTNTIKDFFSWYDIEHMKLITGGSLDLSSYDSVKSNVDAIWGRVSNGTMPPGAGWRQSKRNTFKAWMDAGMPQATWDTSIKKLFDSLDVEHMKQVTGNNLKLDDYNSVKIAAGEIWAQVSQGYMPPGGAWPQEKRNTFKAWMDAGTPL